jgi:hypothetical protein
MTLQLHLQIAGALLLLLAAMHPFIARHFGWRQELAQVSLFTRQVFFVHALFIALTVAMFGTLSLVYASHLLTPHPLATAVLAGMTLFWSVRLFAQWFIYDRRLWQGHRFNTVMHFLFTAFWCYLTAVYGIALKGQLP